MIDRQTAQVVNEKIHAAHQRLVNGGTVRQFTLDMLWVVRDCLGVVRLTDLAECIKATVPSAKMAAVLGPETEANCPYCGADTASNLQCIPELPDGSNEFMDEVTCGECGGIYRIVWMAVRVDPVQAPEKASAE